ncbi:hypothetical protein ACFY2M_19385 [Streptomyces sp. NPDC001276]|uniref:hypothetical protein n=1 Tax=Streptomyces sp. NPDC001276 TaxID=3364555 RepID=UPI0036940A8C
MSAELARLTAAQEMADKVIATVADRIHEPGPRLLVAVTDPETNLRLATGFVTYQPIGSGRHLHAVREVS